MEFGRRIGKRRRVGVGRTNVQPPFPPLSPDMRGLREGEELSPAQDSQREKTTLQVEDKHGGDVGTE